MAVQPDGKVLVGGAFTHSGGEPHNRIARLNSDGSPDTEFNSEATDDVYSMLLQRDGKILIGGNFTTLCSQLRNYVGRLNSDGTLDIAFDPGANGDVSAMAVQIDGKILFAGGFTKFGGQPRDRIARLNADGSLDADFNPGAGGRVNSLALQADGKILVGGDFATLSGQPHGRIGRLNANGTLDITFNAVATETPLPGNVFALAAQPDGKILVGGTFTSLNGQPRNNIGRLNSDGTLDLLFDPRAKGDAIPENFLSVNSLTVQTDGRILLAGSFLTLGGQLRAFLGRINTDGTPDTAFNPGADGGPTCISVQEDGKILVGGFLDLLGGQARHEIGRLNNTEASTQSLSFDGNKIFWNRGGDSPEVSGPEFDYSIDGVTWTSLGAPARVAGGWELVSVSMPPHATLRARGNVAGGNFNGTSWFVETYGGTPAFVSPLSNANRNAGDDITFNGLAIGEPPLFYQWYHAGVAIRDEVGSSLTIQNLSRADVGTYVVVVTNVHGSVTNGPALLTVNEVTSLNPGLDPDGTVYSVILQPDGKILLGGIFGTVGGQPHTNLCRLNWDGTVDNVFKTAAGDKGSEVNSLAVQTDGKILVGGTFASVGGQPRTNLARLNIDGTLDNSFNPVVGDDGSLVMALALQPDGKILVGGSFASVGGQPRANLARLNLDGTLDTSFDPEPDDGVACFAIQPDGKIIVGGSFTTLGGLERSNIGRLNADGTLDSNFNPGADYSVAFLALQADRKILVGGNFATLGGQSRTNIGRLNSDGTLDTAFNPGTDNGVMCLAVQANGDILVGGNFTTLGGQACTNIGRLNPSGTVDATFNPETDDGVTCLAAQADGNILVGGYFATLGGKPRSRIGRLKSTTPAIEILSHDDLGITWTRGGTSPEVWRTTFDYTLDGINWINLGAGIRIAAGWELPAVSLPSGATLRARGQISGGFSDWFVESTKLDASPLAPPSLAGYIIRADQTISGGSSISVTFDDQYIYFDNGNPRELYDYEKLSQSSFRVTSYDPNPPGEAWSHLLLSLTNLDSGTIFDEDSASLKGTFQIIPPGAPAVNVAIQLSGNLVIEVQSLEGQIVVLQNSTNLVIWSNVATNFSAAGMFTLPQSAQGTLGPSFYRAYVPTQ